jgi:putative phosphoribosyl transferase
MTPFTDRFEAGRVLASKLGSYRERPNALVLAIAKGGVPVAYEIAKELYVAMDIFLARKLGLPSNNELAMGAIASGGIQILNEDIIRLFKVSSGTVDAITRREQQELEKQDRLYRKGRPPVNVLGRCVILVDDGLATGAPMRAAVLALRPQQAARIVVAVPIGAPEVCSEFESEVDEIVCGATADSLPAVGDWYDEDFLQITDEDVGELLQRVASIKASSSAIPFN